MWSPLAPLPEPPYFAVIFASVRSADDGADYGVTAARMLELAAAQPGYIGVESAHEPNGLGITVSYWSSLEAIDAWREMAEHRLAQKMGREQWYRCFALRVCRVERAYGFAASTAGG